MEHWGGGGVNGCLILADEMSYLSTELLQQRGMIILCMKEPQNSSFVKWRKRPALSG